MTSGMRVRERERELERDGKKLKPRYDICKIFWTAVYLLNVKC